VAVESRRSGDVTSPFLMSAARTLSTHAAKSRSSLFWAHSARRFLSSRPRTFAGTYPSDSPLGNLCLLAHSSYCLSIDQLLPECPIQIHPNTINASTVAPSVRACVGSRSARRNPAGPSISRPPRRCGAQSGRSPRSWRSAAAGSPATPRTPRSCRPSRRSCPCRGRSSSHIRRGQCRRAPKR